MSKNSLQSIVNQSMLGLMRTQMRLFRKLKKVLKVILKELSFEFEIPIITKPYLMFLL
jgi:hypothetical protein